MTFPSKNVSELHPSLPRRPKRTPEQHKHQAPARPRVVFEARVCEWLTLQIYLNQNPNSLSLVKWSDDSPDRPFAQIRFSERDIPKLEHVIALAKTATHKHMQNVSTIELKDNWRIELGVRAGVVGAVIRRIGEPAKSRKLFVFENETLAAFEAAVVEFKKMTAAKAAL